MVSEKECWLQEEEVFLQEEEKKEEKNLLCKKLHKVSFFAKRNG